MSVKCPKCGAGYNVQPDRVHLSGLDMKCSKCLHTFHISPGDLEDVAQPAPASTRLGLRGVTFLGGGQGEEEVGSGYYIRAAGGQVMGPFDTAAILQMLRTSKLAGTEMLSTDKTRWSPLTSVDEFDAFIKMRSGVAPGGSTRFLGRPGSTEGPGSEGSMRARGMAPVEDVELGSGLDLSTGFSLEIEGGDLGGVEDFSLEIPGVPDGDLSGFALQMDVPELPRPLGAGGRKVEAPELPRAVGGELPDPFELDYGGDGAVWDGAELPGLPGAELPDPFMDDAELPMPRGGMQAELPAPAGLRGGGVSFEEMLSSGAELPRARGGLAELPAAFSESPELPAALGGGVELPRARSRGAGAELPAPRGGELPMSRGAGAELPRPAGAELPRPAGAELPGSRGALGGSGDDLFDDPLESDPFSAPPRRGMESEDEFGARAEYQDRTRAGGDGYESAFGVKHRDEATAGVDAQEYRSVMGLGGGGEVPDGRWGQAVGSQAAPAAPPTPAAPPQRPRPAQVAAPEPSVSYDGELDAEELPAYAPPAEGGKGASKASPARVGSGGNNKVLMIAIVLLAVALLVVGGLILGQTEYGYFGMNLLTGGGGSAPPVAGGQTSGEPVQRPVAAGEMDFSGLRADTTLAIRAYVDEHGRKLAERPDDPSVRGEMMAAWLVGLAHEPEQESYRKNMEGMEARLTGDDPGSRMGRGALAVLRGQGKAAEETMKPLTEDERYAYMAHLVLGLSELMAPPDAPPDEPEAPKVEEPKPEEPGGEEPGGEEQAGGEEKAGGEDFDMTEEVLQERKGSDRRKRSLTHLEAAAKLAPDAPAPRYFMGVMAQRVNDTGEARKALDAALKAAPEHVPSLLLAGRLAYLSADLEKAESYARPVAEKLASATTPQERSAGFLLLGQVHVARRESEAAVTQLTEALKLDPTNTAALKELGQEFFRNGRYEEALNFFTTNAQLSAKDPEVMLSVVISHIGLEQYDKAITMLEQGSSSFPTDPKFPYYLAQIHEQRGNWFEAQQGYRKALEIDPAFPKARVRLATLMMRENKKADARKLLEETEQSTGLGDPDMLVELGRAWMMLREEERGLKLLKRAMGLNASNLDARLALARYHLGKGEAKQALELLKPFAESKSDDVPLTILLADVFREAGQYERSIEQVDRLIERYPKDPAFVFKRGLAYFRWNNMDTAKEQFLKAYQLQPSYQDAYFYAGRVDFEKKEYTQAMKVFRAVLDEAPSNGEYRFYLGYALEKNGNLTQALEEYNNVERYAPDYGKVNPELFYRRGRILAMEGNYRRAKEDLIQVLRTQPDHVGAMLSLGDTLFDERKYEEAIALYERALKQRSDLPRAHFQVGRAYTYQRKRPEAIRSLERAIELGLEEPEAFEMLGFLHRDNGNGGKAAQSFRRYLDMKPDASNRKEIERELSRLGG